MNTPKIITAILVSATGAIAVLIAHSVLSDGGSVTVAPAGGGGTGAPVVVQVTPVGLGRVENSVVINGDVLTQNQVAIFPTVGGRLVETRRNIGDTVQVGNIVAMIDPSRPGEVFLPSPVISTVSGTVLQAPFSVGDTVSTNSSLYVVGDLSSLRLETFVPERFVSSIVAGLPATVILEAIPGETFHARIDEISPVLDPASRTLRVRLHFVNAQGQAVQDPRIRAGMFATITLVTMARDDVPVIPRDSAIRTQGRWVAFTVDENDIARRRELELGMESELLFEVRYGLALGEIVVSAGQNFLEDGDRVRIVE